MSNNSTIFIKNTNDKEESNNINNLFYLKIENDNHKDNKKLNNGSFLEMFDNMDIINIKIENNINFNSLSLNKNISFGKNDENSIPIFENNNSNNNIFPENSNNIIN